MDQTPHLALPYIAAAQAQKHVTHNEALRTLDVLTQICVKDKNITVPPNSPLDGDCYIVAVNATGSWAGKDHKIAAFQDNSWFFYNPREGWLAWIANDDKLWVFEGVNWVEIASFGSNLSLNPATGDGVGINATADTTNRLSVSSPATLLNHEGSGHQLKINKNTAADTASLLYQDNWSGRAEMGLTGDDNFHIKVSGDGTGWKEAITVDKTTAKVSFPNTDEPVAVTMRQDNKSQPAFKMIGVSSAGSEDPAHGVGLYLTYNVPGNRQFVLADTETKKGVRFLGINIEGFQNGGRKDLNIGTSTTGASVGIGRSGTKFNVSNWGDDATKIVHSIEGTNGQTGHLLEITSSRVGAVKGDVLVVKSTGQMDLGGPAKLKNYTVATVPPANTSGTGAMIFVSDETGGAIPAFSDGIDWRRCSDRIIIS